MLPRRFVIVTCKRSRSNLLVSRLNQNPQVLCHGELFLTNHTVFSPKADLQMMLSATELESDRDTARRDLDPPRFLDSALRANIGYPCVGHKLVESAPVGIIESELENPNVAKVVLVRNPFYRFSSEVLATQTGVWEQTSLTSKGTQNHSVRFDAKRFLSQTRDRERFLDQTLQRLNASGQRYLLLFSETLANPATINQVSDFLEVEQCSIDSSIGPQVQNTTSLEHRFSNYSELEALVEGSRLAPMTTADRIMNPKRWRCYEPRLSEQSKLQHQLQNIARLDNWASFEALRLKVNRTRLSGALYRVRRLRLWLAEKIVSVVGAISK